MTFIPIGGGTINYISKWNSNFQLTNSVMYEISDRIGINNTSPNFTLDVIAPAIAGNELIANFTTSDNTDSSLSIRNATGTGNVFVPQILGVQDTTLLALQLQGRATVDTGTTAIMSFNSRIGVTAPAVTRPLFTWVNYTTEVMRIAANGNVGIGTNAPGEKLEVNGNITISPSTTTGQLNIGTSANRLFRDNTSDLTLAQRSGSAGALYLDSIGDVTVAIDSNNNATSKFFRVIKDGFKSGTELFRVQEDGRVGVADNNPNGVLTVKASTTSSSHVIFNARNSAGDINIFDVRGSGVCYINGNSATAQLRFRRLNAATNATKGTISAFDVDDFVVAGINFSSGPSTDNSGQIIFRTTPSSAVTAITSIPERMRIDVDGNVGIARANPTEKLDVVGNVKISNLMKLTGIASDPSSPDNGDIWHNTTANEIRVRLNGVTLKLNTSSI